ncbi:hypothetical protein LAZ67_7001968, partial [Cordylochernes scorpioides]
MRRSKNGFSSDLAGHARYEQLKSQKQSPLLIRDPRLSWLNCPKHRHLSTVVPVLPPPIASNTWSRAFPRDMNVTTTAPVTTVQNVEDTNSSFNFPSPSSSLSDSSSLDSSSFCSNPPSNIISRPPATVFSTLGYSDNPLPQQPPSHEEPLPSSCEQKHPLFLKETNNAAERTPLHLQPAQTSVPQPLQHQNTLQQSLPPIEARVTTSPIPIAPPVLTATIPIAEQPIVSLQASKMVATHYIRPTFKKDRCLPQAPKTRSQPNKAPYQEFPLRLHRIFKDPTRGGVVWRPRFASASANWDKASKHIRAEEWRPHYASASTCWENTSLRMRGRHLELTSDWRADDLKWRAVGRMEGGQSQVEVAKWLNVNKSVVSKIWKQFIETETIKRKEGSSRKRKTATSEDRYLVVTAKRHREMTAIQLSNELSSATGTRISRQTVYRRLHEGALYARRPMVCIPLTSADRRARLNWCLEHHAWTHDQWANVLFSDESRFREVNPAMMENKIVAHLTKGISEEIYQSIIILDIASIDEFIKWCRKIEASNKKRVKKRVVFDRLPNVAAIDSADSESMEDLIRRILREEVHRALNPESTTPEPSSLKEIIREEIKKNVAAISKPIQRPPPRQSYPNQTRTFNQVPRRQYPTQTPIYNQTPPQRRTDEWRTHDNIPICFNCGRPGHVKRYCRERRQWTQRPEGHAPSTQEPQMVISDGLRRQLKKTMFKDSGMTLKVADGKNVTSIGRCTISLSINGLEQPLEFIVLPNSNPSIILGWDFLEASNAVIDCGRAEIRLEEAKDVLNSPASMGKVVASRSIVIPAESTKLINVMSEELNGQNQNVLNLIRRRKMRIMPVMLIKVTLIFLQNLISDDLSEEQQSQILSILKRYDKIFDKNNEPVKQTSVTKHKIETGNHQPIKHRPYRVSPTERQAIQTEVDKMLDAGIIRHSESPWSSPVILVKDGNWRFCVDYRRLNKVTKKDVYPLPRIDDTLDSLKGAKFYSSMDLRSGYWQIEVDEADREKTAFITPDGLYEFLVMPFGLCNAPATFERMMDKILKGLKWTMALCYLDDIVVYSKSFNEHLHRLEIILQCLDKAELRLNPKKCLFGTKRIRVFGHLVDSKGIYPDPEKIEAIAKFPTPKSITDVRSFIGLCSYYRRFIENFAEKAAPLHEVLKKDNKFTWNSDQQDAFDSLKKALMSEPVLAYFEEQLPTELHTDASGYGIGAVLVQINDGKERPVGYASRTLSKAEKNYSTTERECLAAIWAINKFRPYLFGREFVIVTDHHALCWLSNLKDPTGRLARWALKLQEYNVTVVYKSGRKHQDADCLSRNPLQLESEEAYNDEDDDIPSITALTCFEAEQRKDPKISKLIEETERFGAESKGYEMLKGTLYKKNFDPLGNQHLLVIPKHLRLELLKSLHDAPTAGHLGFSKTYERVKNKYFWPGLLRDIRKYVAHCKECQRKKQSTQKPPGLLKAIPPATSPFQRVGMDLLGRFPKSDTGNKWIIVCTDYLTRFAVTKALPTGEAKEAAKFLMEDVILKHGAPREIITDRGRVFQSKLIAELTNQCSSIHRFTTAYHPQTNGLTERLNKTLANMIAMYVSVEQKDWDVILPYVTFAYNTAKQDTTGFTPFKLIHGREVETTVDTLFPNPHEDLQEDYSQKIASRVEETRQLARLETLKAQEKDKARYDSKHEAMDYNVGDLVWIFIPIRKVGLSEKLMKRYFGPYRVTRKLSDVTFEVEPVDQPTRRRQTRDLVHVLRMKPYHDPEDQADLFNDEPARMERDKKLRSVTRTRFTKVVNVLDSEISKTNVDLGVIRDKFSKLKYNDFKLKDLDQKMLDHMMVADAEEDTLNCEIEEAEHYSDTFITLERKVRELIDSDNKSDVKSLGSSNGSLLPKSYKLPKIEIRKFDGELINWLPFWAQFENIHEDTELHDADKFHYLVQSMQSNTRARELIESYPQTAENYAKALQALKQRYGQKDLLVEIYVSELLKLMMANVKTPPDERRSVAKLYDKLETQLRSLESLGVDTKENTAWMKMCWLLGRDHRWIIVMHQKTLILTPALALTVYWTFLEEKWRGKKENFYNQSELDTLREFEFLGQNIICGEIPRTPKGAWLNELKGSRIWLSDLGRDSPKIELLIGSDIYGSLLSGRVKQLENGLTAIETHLGRTICGPSPKKDEQTDYSSLVVISMHSRNMSVDYLWDLETIGIKDPRENLTKLEEDKIVHQQFLNTVHQLEDGRFCVGLPWLGNQEGIPSNRHIAERRLFNTTRKLRVKCIFSEYDRVFQEWLAEGVIEKVSPEDLNRKCHYLPHHPVVKADSNTTKIRPVFDASCKDKGNLSLNDCLASGPNVIEQIPAILLKFREKAIGLISDIRKAFLQIEVKEEDRDYLRFLWWKNNHQIQVFRHKRVVFGVTCSPYLLGAVTLHHLKGVSSEFGALPQKLMESWTVKTDWDEPLPSTIQENFMKWYSELDTLADIKIPRRVGHGIRAHWSIHIFCDASQSAYAAAAFLRCPENKGVSVQLLMAKSRLGPLKKTTIPRMELLACMLGVRLSRYITESLNLAAEPVYYWTDSTTALSWIKTNRQWGTFVNNRVKEICNTSGPNKWFYVPGSLNLADLPSRGCSVLQLKRTRWWEGPEWLKQPQDHWPKQLFHSDRTLVNLEIDRQVLVTTHARTEVMPWFEIFSNFTKIVRINAWIRRAIHLELVTSLSTEAFIQALRRFIARRGRPTVIYSDNGTNFVGANNALKALNWKKIVLDENIHKISWKFIPPTAAWWGGWWERLIRSIKDLLVRILGHSSVYYEEMSTILCDAEATINSRPLTYIHEDFDNLIPLSPSMFLHDSKYVGVPDLDKLDSKKFQDRYRHCKRLREALRSRFRSEYLGQLVQKANERTPKLSVGDVVTVKMEDKRRLHWPMARIVELFPGRDGHSRVAKVRTKLGTLIRPVQKLYPLEVLSGDPILRSKGDTTIEKEHSEAKQLDVDA